MLVYRLIWFKNTKYLANEYDIKQKSNDMMFDEVEDISSEYGMPSMTILNADPTLFHLQHMGVEGITVTDEEYLYCNLSGYNNMFLHKQFFTDKIVNGIKDIKTTQDYYKFQKDLGVFARMLESYLNAPLLTLK